jgi:poly-beta-1,6-N-acetyl-D-glucosamine synthase
MLKKETRPGRFPGGVKPLDPRWWLGARPGFARKKTPPFTIAVVIPAYNEEPLIAKTLESLMAQTVKADEIIVVDDCSQDRTGEIAAAYGVKVVCTHLNQGSKSMALNYVLKRIDADLIVTLDADTLLAPDALEKTLPYFLEKSTFAVCGFVVPQRIKSIWERGRFIEYLFGITVMKGAQNNIGLVVVASGCFTVFRNSVLRELGWYKERTLAEDMDLTWEASFRGYRVWCEQKAVCFPLDPPTLPIYFRQLRRWYSGFLQCMAVHKKDLVRNWRFGFLFSYYLLEALFFPFLTVSVLVYCAGSVKLLAAVLTLHFLILIIPSLLKALCLGLFWKAVFSFPAFFLTRPVNIAALYASVYREWIEGKHLRIWNKGH